ncbi:transposase family protein [Streptomyces pini]
MLDVPHEVVEHVSWLIYARRCELNSRWRKLGCFRQALLVLVHLRKNETLAQAAAGFGVSTATAGRYVSETVDLLAERAPSLHEALRELPPEGFVILDGTLITTDRIAADEPYYSQKHRHHDLPEHYQQYNRNHARLRAPGERAFARLKQWQILRKARCSTNRIGRTVAAVHAIEIAWRSG